MGIRESINQNKPLGYGLTGLFVVAAIGLAVWVNSSGFPSATTRAYFSDDDGKTYFVDDVNNIPPFDHGGKQAHQAFVFKVGSNKPFVAYLLTYKPETCKALRDVIAHPDKDVNGRLTDLRNDSLVKRPGEATWRPSASPEGIKATFVETPAGQTGDLQAVYP